MNEPITVHHFLERMEWRTYSRQSPKGSGYCRDQGQYVRLVKQWKLFGWVIWTKEIAREEVPSYVWIQEACYGFCIPEWKTTLKVPT